MVALSISYVGDNKSYVGLTKSNIIWLYIYLLPKSTYLATMKYSNYT